MVKCSSLPEYYCTEKFLFPSVYPLEIQAAASNFLETIQTIFRENKAAAEEANTYVRSVLCSLGQPAKLEVYKAGGTLPDSLWVRISQFQALGGTQGPLQMIQNMLNELKKISAVYILKLLFVQSLLI